MQFYLTLLGTCLPEPEARASGGVARNPFPFMDLQAVQELTNFFERRASAYQVGVQGEVAFDAAF